MKFLSCCLVLVLFLGGPGVVAADAQAPAKPVVSEKKVIVYAQKFIDAGEYRAALNILSDGVRQFPSNDIVLALNGEAHYLSGNIEEAERYFMSALLINAHNEVAKKYIEEIRDVKTLSVSEESQEWVSIARDKFGDFIILVIGIWLGTTLNSFGSGIKRWRDDVNSKKHFDDGDYVAFTDRLEMQASEHNIAALRKNIDYMLSKKSIDEAKLIVEDFADSEDNVRMFLRMIERHEKWKDGDVV